MPSKIIFFDTETTGNTADDFLCQLAYKHGEESFANLYRPLIKIPAEASAIHHITNKIVEDKPIFRESADFEKVKKIFEDDDSVLVAHNAPFDLAIMKKEGIVPKNFICTLRVARHLDPDEKLSGYKLQYLRYALDIEIDATAHDALGDVLVLEKLFDRLRKKLMDQYSISPAEALEKMIEISSHPSVFRRLNFGKYKGRSLEEVLEIDRGWLIWLLNEKEKSVTTSAGGDEDWIYTLRHYLEK